MRTVPANTFPGAGSIQAAGAFVIHGVHHELHAVIQDFRRQRFVRQVKRDLLGVGGVVSQDIGIRQTCRLALVADVPNGLTFLEPGRLRLRH